MKFLAEPGLTVKIMRRPGRPKNIRYIKFNESGIFETDNEVLIKLLGKHFEVVKEEIVTENKTELCRCKKCDFETENKGELLAHYRKEHKK